MKKILFVVFVTILLLAAIGDAWLRSFAEERASDRLAEVLDLEGEPRVSLNGWPFMYRLLVGSFPSASVEADGVTALEARLRELSIEMENVDFDASKLLAGDADAVTAASGEGTAVLTSASLADLAGARADVTISIRGDRLRIGSPRLPRRVTGDVRLRAGRELVIEAPRLGDDIVIRLPEIVEGLSYDSVDLRQDRLLLRFSLRDARLVAGS